MVADLIAIFTGVVLVGITLLDVFQTLFNPMRAGSLSHRVINVLWRHTPAFRRYHHRVRSLTGSLFIVSIILFWIATMVIGWALIYSAYLPQDGLLLTPGLSPEEQAGFVDALYVSGVMLVTLGFGDITPTGDLLRILMPIEGGVGFVLLTAGISWMLGIYPALARQQQLAQMLALLERQLGCQGFVAADFNQAEAPSIARDLAQQILAVRNDLLQFPIIFYFHSPDPRSDLARTVHYLPRLLEQFPSEADVPQYAAAQGLLQLACTDLEDTLGSCFLGNSEGSIEVLEAYAELTGVTTEYFGAYDAGESE